MRILSVIHTLDPARGGPAEALRHYARQTATMGHRQEVLTLDAPDAPWLRDFPAPVHALGPAWNGYGFTPRLRPWLRRNAGGFDAVVVHGLWQYHGLAVRQALHGSATPYFVFFHGMLDPWFRHRYPLKHLKKWLYWPWADYRVARDARAVLFTAQEEMQRAAQSFRLYRVRPAVVGYGLALDAAARQASAEDLLALYPALRGKRIVLFLSRLHEKKGCDLLLEAFARVAGSDPALHLVMAGPDAGGLRPALERRATELGIAQRVTWSGMLAGRVKWGALRAAEVFALPSHHENFGVAVAEALAMGVPVLISTRVNIWREIVAAGAGFAGDDSADGAAALLARWLALTPGDRAVMGGRASACYSNHFRIEAAAARFIDTLGAPGRP